MTDLTGKVALVTGASSGLGAAVAQLFARRGASVFGVARDTERLATVFADVPGGRFAGTDISTAQACTAAVAQCVAQFGRLDVLVNVAGAHQMRHTLGVTDDEWAHDLAVNLNGPFYLCRAGLPHLLETAGNIVNVASIAGVEGQAYWRAIARQSTGSSGSPGRWPWSSPRRSCGSTPCVRVGC